MYKRHLEEDAQEFIHDFQEFAKEEEVAKNQQGYGWDGNQL